jgi:translation initiation factor 1
MSRLFAGTSLDRPVTCERCEKPLAECRCPRGQDGQIRLPKDQPVRVRREKRRGKVTTVVSGLDPQANDLPVMLKAFKAALGAGGTIAEGELELQGDHRDMLIERLKAMGFPAKASGG